jgi:hypothetical protein
MERRYFEAKLYFGDRDMESRDDSSQNPQNVKVKNMFLNKVVVTTNGHICGIWRKELVQTSSILGIATWSVETLHHRKSEMRNAEMPKCLNVDVAGGHCRWSRKWKELA